MKRELVTDFLVRPYTTLREVMQLFSEMAIHSEGKGFAVVTDNNGVCLAVVTDGDVRKALLKSHMLDSPIEDVMNRNFTCAHVGDSSHKILRLFDRSVRTIPVLDGNGKVVDILCYSDYKSSEVPVKKIIRAKVPVRVSFAGGGTDMSYYMEDNTGYVLSSTINKYCYATILVRPDKKVRIISRDYRIQVEATSVDQLKYDGKLDLLKACVKLVDPQFGFDLETYSEIEPGTGLGTSSAMSAAVIGAFNEFRQENHLDRYHIADLAYQAERVELGIAGGWQDQYATVFGGFSFIEFRRNEVLVTPINMSEETFLELQYNLLLFRFGTSRNSGEITLDQQACFAQSKKSLKISYDQLGQLALRMKECVLRGSLREFGHLLNEGWELKKKLSPKISNHHIDSLYAAALDRGALGGKVLGAGREGYLLIYCSPAHQVSVKEKLEALGARAESFDFVTTGLQTWKTRSELSEEIEVLKYDSSRHNDSISHIPLSDEMKIMSKISQ